MLYIPSPHTCRDKSTYVQTFDTRIKRKGEKGRKEGRKEWRAKDEKVDKAEENIVYLLHVYPVLVWLIHSIFNQSQSVERNEACYIRTGVFSKAFSVPHGGRMNFWTGTKKGNRRGDNQCQSQWQTQITKSLTHPIRFLAWADENIKEKI